ncbi:aspartate/glutamate/uridylate kinase [Thermocladium modestius]|uniref:Isopentenyl phosphate kinase n=1 Tax=Thermocladium modestius TaxID=62609 RepID=A0A830GUD0_9CREN|nr:isopentenyl phosphate kinase [Thermocladium modestius]GGP20832.1 aspartate/glutamate/uridylate kinase [Thermocladium modestius]
MLIIKIGGSAVTDKSRPLSLDLAPIQPLARLIRRSGEEVVLIHGGGSFAHPIAKAYGLGGGVRDEGQLIGVALTTAALEMLSHAITIELAKGGVAAYYVRTGDAFRAEGGRAVLADAEPILDAMRRGAVPMLHGDVVRDSELGFSIISGDAIAEALARLLRPRAALFLMDVDGVYSEGPGRGRLLRRLARGEDSVRVGGEGIDVTGGLSGKLRHAWGIVEAGARVFLCSIRDLESLEAVVGGGEPPKCTELAL